jgi:hypothetical protein
MMNIDTVIQKLTPDAAERLLTAQLYMEAVRSGTVLKWNESKSAPALPGWRVPEPGDRGRVVGDSILHNIAPGTPVVVKSPAVWYVAGGSPVFAVSATLPNGVNATLPLRDLEAVS